MPRKKRTLKSIEEAQALVDAAPKRRRRSPFQIKADTKAKQEARQQTRLEARGATPELLDSLGITAATKTPHFLNDGMVSSPFRDRYYEPLIPFLFEAPDQLTPLEFLKVSKAYRWWVDQNAKEKEACRKGQPQNRWLCKRWAGPHFDNIEYIRVDHWTSPGANGIIPCDVLSTEEILQPMTFFQCCCPPLCNFLVDIGVTCEGATPTRQLLSEKQRRENDSFAASGLNGAPPWPEWRNENIKYVRPDRSRPYGPDNFEVQYDFKPHWVMPEGEVRDRKIRRSRVHRALQQFVFRHGQPAVDLLHGLRDHGTDAALETVSPFFGDSLAFAQNRAAFIGSAADAAKRFNTTPEIIRTFKDISDLNGKTDELRSLWRKYNPGQPIPDDTATIRLVWPNCFWDEFCPEALLCDTLSDHIKFFTPWRLTKTQGERLIGPELYHWLKNPDLPNEATRYRRWERIRTYLAVEGTDWWIRDWKDAERQLPGHGGAMELTPLPGFGELYDFKWRASQLFDLLRNSTQVDVLNKHLNPMEGREVKPDHVHRHARAMPKQVWDLYFETVRAFGAYALAGGPSFDWWLLGSIGVADRDCVNGFYPEKRSRRARTESLEKRIAYKTEDYAFYAIGPDGRTRPAAGAQREAWERSMRTLVRMVAGEAGAGVYFEEPSERRWNKALVALKGIVVGWGGLQADGDADFPRIPLSEEVMKTFVISKPYMARAMDVINRNRHRDEAWEAIHAERDRAARAKRDAEGERRLERERRKRAKRKVEFDRRVAQHIAEGMDPKKASEIEFNRVLAEESGRPWAA